MYSNTHQDYNKRLLALNMSQGNKEFQTLLNLLSTKEILILRKHDELMDKVHEISKMGVQTVLEKLQTEYALDIDHHVNGDVWIGTEQLEDGIPDWFESSHCGWFKSLDKEFMVWARTFLMQEVRINIWIQYLEHEKEKAKLDMLYPNTGMYL